VVTEMRVRLAEIEGLYGGPLFFGTDHIETALKGWIEWTKSADPRVTTSIAIVRFPPFEFIPEPLRGQNLLALRFAFPGSAEEGEALAAPLRELAPVHMDGIRPMQLDEADQIHGDPTDPGPAWLTASLLSGADADFADVVLKYAGPGTECPFVAVEIRHIDGPTGTDIEAGSAAGGRGAPYSIGAVSKAEDLFAAELPALAEQMKSDLAPWIAAEGNVNFAGSILSAEHFATAWSPETFARLAEVRGKYDPDVVVAWGFLPS
jgi:hypothetical protein